VTASVRIRPYASGDEHALHAAVRESILELSAWMDWCHPAYSLADSRSWVEQTVAKRAELAEFHFVIASASDRFLGGCGLDDFAGGGARANLGYWVRSSATQTGVAGEAVRQLADWAWANTQLVRLEVVIDVANTRSLRVAEKLALAREGVLRKRIRRRAAWHDAVLFSWTR
jgi:RimJ/RimL family protein N-acetyltransferase